MNDATHARLARKHGCKACSWWKRSVTHEGPAHFGQCLVNPPRTSSQKFPLTYSNEWCGEWVPIVELPGEA